MANKLVGRLWILLDFRQLSPTLIAAHKGWQTFSSSEKYETDLMEKLFQNGENSNWNEDYSFQYVLVFNIG